MEWGERREGGVGKGTRLALPRGPDWLIRRCA